MWSHLPSTRRSPGRGLGIRQSMGWTKVCEIARSGTWVLKGNARARMLPDNLDHFRVGWRPRGTYETAWVTPGHDCLCLYKYGHGAAVRPQTNNAIWDVVGLWVHCRTPHFALVCKRGELEPVLRFKICILWHSDNKSLFGPTNQPKFIVSMGSGHSVEFQVRRAS